MITIKQLIQELQQFPNNYIIEPYSAVYSDDKALFIKENITINSKIIAVIENKQQIDNKEDGKDYYIIIIK